MQQYEQTESYLHSLNAKLVTFQQRRLSLELRKVQINETLHLITICKSYILQPCAPIESFHCIMHELPVEYAAAIRINTMQNMSTGIYKINDEVVNIHLMLRREYIVISSSVQALDHDILRITAKIEEELKPFPIMDLPLEIFAQIAQFLPAQHRRVCTVFRMFVPIVHVNLTVDNSWLITSISPDYFLGTGPVTIIMHTVTNNVIQAAAQIAKNRKLTLILGKTYLHHSVDAQLSPTSLNIQNANNLDFINMDKLNSLRVNKVKTLAKIAHRLTNTTPLNNLIISFMPHGRFNSAQNSVIIRSSGTISMSTVMLYHAVQNHIHFLHPPHILYQPGYDGLYFLTIDLDYPDYLLNELELTGRTKLHLTTKNPVTTDSLMII